MPPVPHTRMSADPENSARPRSTPTRARACAIMAARWPDGCRLMLLGPFLCRTSRQPCPATASHRPGSALSKLFRLPRHPPTKPPQNNVQTTEWPWESISNCLTMTFSSGLTSTSIVDHGWPEAAAQDRRPLSQLRARHTSKDRRHVGSLGARTKWPSGDNDSHDARLRPDPM